MWTLWKVKHSWSTYSTDFSKLGPPCALCTGTEFWRLNFPKKSPSRMNNVIAMETLERHQEAIKATNMEGKIIKTKTQLLFTPTFQTKHSGRLGRQILSQTATLAIYLECQAFFSKKMFYLIQKTIATRNLKNQLSFI